MLIQKIKSKYELLNDIKFSEIIIALIPLLIIIRSPYLAIDMNLLLIIFWIGAITFMPFLYYLGIKKRIFYFVFFLLGFFLFTVYLELRYPSPGQSDRHEAIIMCIKAFLRGEFPYYSKTPNGNYTGIFPLNFLIFIPTYLIFGENFLSISIVMLIIPPLFFVCLYKWIDSKNKEKIIPLMSFWTFGTWWFVVNITISDLYLSMLFGCIAILFLPKTISKSEEINSNGIKLKVKKVLQNFFSNNEHHLSDKKNMYLAIIFASLSTAMRIFNFIILIPVLLYILRCYGLRNAFKSLLISIIIIGGTILPFFLMDPLHFIEISPFPVNYKFEYDNFLAVIFHFGNWNSVFVALIILIIICFGAIFIKNNFELMLFILLGYGILFIFFFLSSTRLYLMDYTQWIIIPCLFIFLMYDKDSTIEHQMS